MAAPTNHWKLGLFVVVGFAAAILTVVLFGAASMRKETVHYHTYFNESVQGLDVGSAVKFRGVTIGFVSAIEIAPDHRLVDVVEELDVADIKRLGLLETGHGLTGKPKFAMPEDLRAQLGSQGITGVKFVSIDFFDVKSNPAPTLPFSPAVRYIPAAPSMMKNLEDTITKAMDRLPDMVDAVVMIMGRVDRLLATLEKEDVSHKAAAAIAHADQVMTAMHATIIRIDHANLGEKAASTIDDLRVAVGKMNNVLDRFDGGAMAADVDTTLRDVSEAADAIRKLAEALERDPDMLVKGKSKGKSSK